MYSSGFHKQLKSETAISINKLKRIINRMYIYRLTSFISIFAGFWIFRNHTEIAALVSIGFTILFLWLVRKNILLENEIRYHATRLRLIERELKALQFDFSDFSNGQEFSDPGHPYLNDLDIFGPGSLYQSINRTTTSGGSRVLANWFMTPEMNYTEIFERQIIVNELSGMRKWRLDFLTEGNLLEISETEKTFLTDTNQSMLNITQSRVFKNAVGILPLFTISALLLFIITGIHIYLVTFLFINFCFGFFYRKEVERFYNIFGNKSNIVRKYLGIIQLTENQIYNSAGMLKLQAKITIPVKAFDEMKKLSKIMTRFDYRSNILVGLILNLLSLWDIRCILLLWKWNELNKQNLKIWTGTIEEIDALVSLANFRDNNPGYEFPVVQKGPFIFSAKNMGHPLLNPQKRIDNNFELSSVPKIAIITGANMAGKSTFLRSIGVNMVLAHMGAPVCCSSMVFTPVPLFTSMRTTDSLIKDESYFLAELKRLADIMKHLRKDETLLVILDEMLKGTNSEDKLKGSQQLVKHLAKTKVAAIIATHDVKLTEIENDLPGTIENFCFEITHKGNDMLFDYKLQNGVTKTMNALLLMKKLGITD